MDMPFSVKLYFNWYLNMVSLFQTFGLIIKTPFVLHFTIHNLHHINMVSLVEKKPYLTKLENKLSNKECINCFPPEISHCAFSHSALSLAVLQSHRFKSRISKYAALSTSCLAPAYPRLFFPFTEDITHFPIVNTQLNEKSVQISVKMESI